MKLAKRNGIWHKVGSGRGENMSDVLKGNFKTKTEVKVADVVPETVEDRFEREAKKRLGGSIAYVAKKKVMWDLKDKI
jgi:hypothetical protein